MYVVHRQPKYQGQESSSLPRGSAARCNEWSVELGVMGPRSSPGSITHKPCDLGQASPLSPCSLSVPWVLPSSHIRIRGKRQCLQLSLTLNCIKGLVWLITFQSAERGYGKCTFSSWHLGSFARWAAGLLRVRRHEDGLDLSIFWNYLIKYILFL